MAFGRQFLAKYWFPTILAVGFSVFGTLPYIYGYLHAGPDTRFMGFVGRGLFGPNGYMMLARQAQYGRYLLENLMTPEDLPRVFFNLEWWLFGRAASWTGLSLIGIFHVSRVATVFLFMFCVWYLVRQCLDTDLQQKFALALIALGSGFGWILWLASKAMIFVFPAARVWATDQNVTGEMIHGMIFPMPMDVPGVSIPAYLVNQPHFVVAVAFAALMCAFLIAGEKSGRVRYFVLAGLAAVAHLIIRPYNIPEMYLMFALYPTLLAVKEQRFEMKRFLPYIIPALMAFPMVAYYGWLNMMNAMGPGRPGWPLDSFVDHIMWLGLPFLAMFLYIEGLGGLRTAKPSSVLLALWMALAFLIEQARDYYSSGQEAMFPAFVVVPPILATAGPFRQWYHALRDSRRWRNLKFLGGGSNRFRTALAVAVVVFCMPSAVLAYGRMFTGLQNRPTPYYISQNLDSALKWLESNAQAHDTVLATFDTGQLVPRVSGVKAFQGHYMITINAMEKRDLAERFFVKRGDDAFKQSLVTDYKIRYVIVGSVKEYGYKLVPSDHPWLVPRYSKGDVCVYEVVKGSPNAHEKK